MQLDFSFASLYCSPQILSHGLMVKCPLDVHFSISLEVIGHLDNFCVMRTVNLDMLHSQKERYKTVPFKVQVAVTGVVP